EVAGSQAPVIEIVMGQNVNMINYADSGVHALLIGLVVNKSLLQSKPDVGRRFTKATVMSGVYAADHPGEDVQAALTHGAPGGNPDVIRMQVERALAVQDTPNTQGFPVGWMTEPDVNQTVQLLRDYLGVSSAFDPNSFFLNDYLPK